MSFKELFLEEEFKTVFEEIEQFSEEMLVDYNEHFFRKLLFCCFK